MAGVDAGGSRVVKSMGTSGLSVERLELGHVLVGAAVHQADRWVQQWDSLQLAGRAVRSSNTQSGTCEGSHLARSQSRPSDAIIHTILLLLLLKGNQTLLENTGCK